MKKLFLLLLLILPFAPTFAQEECDDCDEPLLAKEWANWTMDLRIAYFHPSSKEVSKIFSHGWIDYEVEAARRIHEKIEFWAGVDWTHKKGHLHKKPYGYHNSALISIVPLSLGFKIVLPVTCNLEAYLGAGASYSFIKIRNHSDFYALELGSRPYKKFAYKETFGGIGKLGLIYTYGKCTYFDFFADYYSVPAVKFSERQFQKRKLDLSGYKLGFGLGVFF